MCSSHCFTFFYSMSINSPWPQVLVGCRGYQNMTILRATVVRERGRQRSKGKSHKEPLVNLIKCDENQMPRLYNTSDSKEEKKPFLKGLKMEQILHWPQRMFYKVDKSIEKIENRFSSFLPIYWMQHIAKDTEPFVLHKHIFTHTLTHSPALPPAHTELYTIKSLISALITCVWSTSHTSFPGSPCTKLLCMSPGLIRTLFIHVLWAGCQA